MTEVKVAEGMPLATLDYREFALGVRAVERAGGRRWEVLCGDSDEMGCARSYPAFLTLFALRGC